MPNEMKHTPGPWFVLKPERGLCAIHARMEEGNTIREVTVASKVDMFDARLIAAAPELLEALKALVAYMEAVVPAAMAKNLNVMRQARSALTRATGGA